MVQDFFCLLLKDLEHAIDSTLAESADGTDRNKNHTGDHDASLNRSRNVMWLQKKANTMLKWENNL